METKWWALIAVSGVCFFVLVFLGLHVPSWFGFTWLSFSENILAELAGSFLALLVAVWLIEGRAATQARRRQELIAKQARPIIQMVGEISSLLSSEIAVDLLNELDTDIDLYGEERGDYKKFRKLLTKVFDQACAVPDNGLPPHSNLTDETIRGCIEGIGHFVDRVRNRIQGDYDLQLTLLELIEQIDHLDKTSTMAMFLHNLRNEKMRFRSLGMMGQAMLSLDDAVDKVASRNTKMLQ